MGSNTNNYEAAVRKDSFDGRYSPESVVVTISVAVALYNSLEMILLIITTFKRFNGLYFWSLVLSTSGIVAYALGMLFTYFHFVNRWFNSWILDIGWAFMVNCQSLVLYSRLGLILRNVKILQGVKWMIIFNASLLTTAVIILDFGNTYTKIPSFAKGYYYIEHIQLIFFTVQELVISGLYVWKTIKLLNILEGSKTRKMIWQLFTINVIIIAMDIALVVLQFLHLQLFQEATKVFVYSVKLKLELNILSKLVDLVHNDGTARSMTLEVIEGNTVPGDTRTDIQQELKGDLNRRSTWFGSDAKGDLNQIRDTPVSETSQSSSVSRSGNENDRDADNINMTRTFSHASRFSARTSGRETDMMYADMLKSMSRT